MTLPKKLKHDTGSEAPLHVIYTRVGSGTICTPFFVYDNYEFKIGGHDPKTIPNRVYASLELMEGLTNEQRIIGVSDILAHATESYLSTAGSESLKARALAVVEQMDTNTSSWPLEQLLELDVEAGLAEAECLVLLPHALGHYLTYTKNVPHGIASIVALPNYVNFLQEQQVIEASFAKQVSELAESLLASYEVKDPTQLREQLHDKIETALPLIQRYMPFALANSPVLLAKEDIKRMLEVTI